MFGRERKQAPPAPPPPLDLAQARVTGVVPHYPATTGRRQRPFEFGRLVVPSLVIDHTLLLMRQNATRGEERFVVWAGSLGSEEAFVSTLVLPRVGGTALHGEVPPDVVGGVLEALHARDLVPVAQLHTHPHAARMSQIDARRPLVAIPGFRSIIVPDFAFVPDGAVETWKSYEYLGAGGWAERDADIVVDDSLIRVD